MRRLRPSGDSQHLEFTYFTALMAILMILNPLQRRGQMLPILAKYTTLCALAVTGLFSAPMDDIK
ncbi:MAG: hypothetical protein C7B46_02700 [Sulfobacillus benefaciens]|uniref:Uncharacterized protein n=1 Tax=Sulfobacillus benefaciens TaxID=453960 RepID=A0A2T2XKS4_9FIRM|nr:MAG: hypothetical protein C7B46_02700 [Sulfobacillus benefaciens]